MNNAPNGQFNSDNSNATVTQVGMDLLAQLFANEGLRVKFDPMAQTALYNPKKREITLPILRNCSTDQYILLTSHEAAHALYTTADLKDLSNKVNDQATDLGMKCNVNIAKYCLNMAEDIRVERKIKAKYPGLNSIYSDQYASMFKAGRFGNYGNDPDAAGNEDPATRINMASKLGLKFGIPLNDKEMEIYQRIYASSSLEETIPAIIELIALLQNYDLPDEDDNDNSEDDGDGDGEGEGESGSNGNKPNNGKGNQKQLSEADMEKMLAEMEKMNQSIVGPDSNSVASGRYNTNTYVHGTLTIDTSPATAEKEYLNCAEIPVDSIKTYQAQSSYYNKPKIDSFKAGSKNIISSMMTEFNRYKAAKARVKAQISASGSINPTKLATYKFNEQIFKNNKIVPKGKNHGIVILMDWSGSMQGSARQSIQQIFSIIDMAKNLNIPCEFYLFTNSNSPYRAYSTLWPMNKRNNARAMLEAASISDKLAEQMMGMGGTPLYKALSRMPAIIAHFKNSTKVDICNFVLVTDGDDGDGISTENAGRLHGCCVGLEIRDKYTNISTHVFDTPENRNNRTAAIPAFLRMIRLSTNCKTLGFFLADYMDQYNNNNDYNTKKESSMYVHNNPSALGYHGYYVIQRSKFPDASDENQIKDIAKNKTRKIFSNILSKSISESIH